MDEILGRNGTKKLLKPTLKAYIRPGLIQAQKYSRNLRINTIEWPAKAYLQSGCM
jgi:hypothetical protein